MSPSHPTTRSAELQENIWRQFDHKLLKLKLDEIRTIFDKAESAESEEIVASSTPQISPDLDLIDLALGPRLRMQEGAELRDIETTRVNAELGLVYGTYRHVWKLQQKKETPDFLRVVLRKGLLPRLSQMKKKLSDTEFYELKEEWKSRVEIKARELEWRQSAPKKESRPRLLTELRGRKRDVSIAERDRIIALLKNSLAKYRGIGRNQKIARVLTEQNIAPPEDWNVASFDAALHNPKLRKRFAKMVWQANLR